mmetsp:Transcript_14775/g.59147  ORF Transcript_14775/g.59147 Transcript_14775/m.59147 type:complete len:239 (-) Transcript_14775:1126-1842(-)
MCHRVVNPHRVLLVVPPRVCYRAWHEATTLALDGPARFDAGLEGPGVPGAPDLAARAREGRDPRAVLGGVVVLVPNDIGVGAADDDLLAGVARRGTLLPRHGAVFAREHAPLDPRVGDPGTIPRGVPGPVPVRRVGAVVVLAHAAREGARGEGGDVVRRVPLAAHALEHADPVAVLGRVLAEIPRRRVPRARRRARLARHAAPLPGLGVVLALDDAPRGRLGRDPRAVLRGVVLLVPI